MTTKTPASTADVPAESLEKIAYASVADIPTQEPNDRNRLGYCVWSWLKDKRGTLTEAIRNSGVRTTMPLDKVEHTVKSHLASRGFRV
ncbi:MAG: hypothetical protein A2X67_05250 [Ignavibacteria bacterium GWA2_55_11]|nr:MAG: hypothetical protein A2X67_05250 [Ignavibacteria bacterium GWA2_55_11]OGU46706.1 MAG: hypothetical protein A2X68_04075 [Ignavibacteria bacterium GWC2_56_12]OGU64702.1 MAG: hypothetical protein A3C56_04310 [Ignavibacteria bacterium RIFCSPHIGHO2_02_FULL_56_12]OGU71587.1 MAG: hypothetical protein A3G43_08565 [Ignavibacteria bacterium RIFCSPLOWO2_12_FULL_56_21]OGU73292.1 MAG: hypothetical protein A3H45_14185 [Ignavibacteria bacterium RIFCSPLOWO2_02_FULL_55_14]HAV24403.1 hypothetical protei